MSIILYTIWKDQFVSTPRAFYIKMNPNVFHPNMAGNWDDFPEIGGEDGSQVRGSSGGTSAVEM